MASAWHVVRKTIGGEPRYRIEYRDGGRDSRVRYGGSFKRKTDADARKRWILGELAAMRMPDIRSLDDRTSRAPSLREAAHRWQLSRVDVRESTKVQHRVALARVLPTLGERQVDRIAPADVAALVAGLNAKGMGRESIRKTVTALAMVLDLAAAPLCGRDSRGAAVNAARDRVVVKLPREEPAELSPPSANHVEQVGWRLTVPYLLGLIALDATGCRLGELIAATVGDLDEHREAWLVRAAVSKTRHQRWAMLPPDVFEAIVGRLPAHEDRDPAAPLFAGVSADRLRTAIARACRDAGVPAFSPHDLRHRRISLLHKQGHTWAEIGALVGQRNLAVTANTYTHVLIDSREVDRAKLLDRVRGVTTPVLSRDEENASAAGTF
jgi:site-specific recombinase XerD